MKTLLFFSLLMAALAFSNDTSQRAPRSIRNLKPYNKSLSLGYTVTNIELNHELPTRQGLVDTFKRKQEFRPAGLNLMHSRVWEISNTWDTQTHLKLHYTQDELKTNSSSGNYYLQSEDLKMYVGSLSQSVGRMYDVSDFVMIPFLEGGVGYGTTVSILNYLSDNRLEAYEVENRYEFFRFDAYVGLQFRRKRLLSFFKVGYQHTQFLKHKYDITYTDGDSREQEKDQRDYDKTFGSFAGQIGIGLSF